MDVEELRVFVKQWPSANSTRLMATEHSHALLSSTIGLVTVRQPAANSQELKENLPKDKLASLVRGRPAEPLVHDSLCPGRLRLQRTSESLRTTPLRWHDV